MSEIIKVVPAANRTAEQVKEIKENITKHLAKEGPDINKVGAGPFVETGAPLPPSETSGDIH